jgi:hypothetical protein
MIKPTPNTRVSGHTKARRAPSLCGYDQSERDGSEDQREALRRHAVDLLQDESRAGDVGEQGRTGESGGECTADEEAIVKQGVVATQSAAEPANDSSFRRQRLLEAEPCSWQQHRAEASQYAKDAPPTHDPAELTTKYWSEHWRKPGDQQQSREEDHERRSGIEIARDRPGDHYPSRSSQALDEPKYY